MSSKVEVNFADFFPLELVDFFNAAYQAASESYADSKHGAVVVKDNRIVSTGYNKPYVGSDEEDGRGKWDVKHAETEAIDGINPELLNGAVVFVARAYNNGCPAYSRPCEYCRMVLPNFGIKKVIYTVPYPPYFQEEIFSSPSP